MSTLKNKKKSELIEEIESLKKKIQDFKESENERKQLEQEAQTRTRKLTIMLNVSRALTSTLEIGEVLQMTTDSATELIGADSAAIYLLNEKELYLGGTTPPLDAMMPDDLRKAQLIDHPHIDKAVKTKHHVILADTTLEALTSVEKTVVEVRRLRSIIYVPIVMENNVFGVLIIGTIEKVRIFSESEINLCQTLANQAAASIQKASLYNILSKQNEYLKNEIIERKQADLSAKESEANLKSLIENRDEPIWSIDKQYNYIIFNDKFKRDYYLAYQKELKKGTNAIEILSPKLQEFWKTKYDLTLSGEKTVFEFSESLDGELLFFEVLLSPIILEEEVTGVSAISINMTKRKLTEKALRDSEMKFRLVTENINDVFWMSTPGVGEMVYISPAFETLWERSRESLYESPKSFLDALHPDDLESYLEIIDKYHKNGKPYDCEYRILKGDGEFIWIQERGYPVPPSLNEAQLMTGICTDITQNKQAEIILEKSEERLKAIFNSAADGIVETDLSGNILKVNKAIFRIYGSDSENDFLGKSALEFYAADDRDRALKAYRQTYLESIAEESEFMALKVDGTPFPVQITSAVLRDTNEKPIGFVGIIKDITERKWAEEALRASEEQYQTLVRQTPAVLWTSDQNGQTTFISSNVEKIYGYTPEEIIKSGDRLWFGRIHSEDLASVKAAYATLMKRGEPYDIEYRIQRQDGDWIWLHDRATCNYEVAGTWRVDGVFFDITERKLAERELRESEEKFRRLVENAPEIIYRFRVSPDPGFEFISPAVTEIAGYTPQEYYDDPEIGRKIIHPEDRSKLDGLYKGIIPEGPHQVRWIRKDGKIIWTEDRAIPIFNDKGEFIAIEGIAREITAQKETEEALKEAYEIINKSSAVPFLWKNEEGWPVEYVSENVAELFEYSAEEFMSGKVRYSELVHPEDTNRIENEVTKFSAEEGRDRFSHEPYRIVTKSGKIKWVEDKTYIRRDENNNLTHYQGIVEDITARKQTELARSESEEKFSKTFNSSPSPMIISEIESGKVVDINKSFEKLIMYSKQEVLGKSVFDLNLWANIEDRGYYIKKMKEDKRVSNLEIKIRTKSEEIRDALISGEIITIMDKPYLLTSGIDITERKQAEEALKEQLHLNQQILETTLDGYILADSDGKIIDVNPAYCDIIGYTWEELLEMNIREVEVKTPPEEVDQRIQQMIRTGGDHFETKHKHKDGHILELDTSTSITYLDEAPRVAAFMRDITERKQAEELIQESERRLATLMSNLPGMAYKCKNDPDWTMEFISDGCYSLTGYYTEELIDNSKVSYADLIHPEDRQMVWDKVQDGIEIKQPFQLNYRITTASGVEKWVWEQGQAIYGKENDVISLEGFITDITEQKQAENKLKESRQRLSSHMNNTPLGAIFWDVDFKVIEWNLSAEKIFGYSKEEALGKHPYKLIVPLEIQGQIDEVFKNLLTQTGGNRSVNENITKNGKRILCDWYNVAITDLAGKVIGVASLVDDITEKTLTEKKLKNSRNQLRSLAERLQMIREEERATVAREIHDDLGQTLTALKMDIAWMKKNSGMTEEMRVSKLDGILELTDSTIQTVKRIATDLRPGILDDLGLLSAIEWQTKEFQNRSSIECKFEIFVDEFTVEDDISIAVFRIFQESLTNIARHSQATKVTVSIRRADDFILVEISDNGVGINEEQINSSKSLGLLGMNERVSVFRGKLTISRAAEGGTAVRVYIPMGKT